MCLYYYSYGWWDYIDDDSVEHLSLLHLAYFLQAYDDNIENTINQNIDYKWSA